LYDNKKERCLTWRLALLVDSKLGRNRSTDGSSFTYPLEPALIVPFDAEPTLRVLEANVFYTGPNVSVATATNKLKLSVITSGTVAGGDVSTTDHISLAHINAELAGCLEATSAIVDAALAFVGHGPTQTAIADWGAEAATYGAMRHPPLQRKRFDRLIAWIRRDGPAIRNWRRRQTQVLQIALFSQL